MKRMYYIAEASWADKLVKNRAHPQWVHILNKEYVETMEKYNSWLSKSVDRNFPQVQFCLYDSFNCQFKGKRDYKGEQGYMDVWPTYRGVFGVINDKFKKILDDLHVSSKEYVAYPISIENTASFEGICRLSNKYRKYCFILLFHVCLSNTYGRDDI